jgi:hypothetical protein
MAGLWYNPPVLRNVVGVAEWLRHLVVAQKTVGSNPTAHPTSSRLPSIAVGFSFLNPRSSDRGE